MRFQGVVAGISNDQDVRDQKSTPMVERRAECRDTITACP
jgi:hypothetical protein